MCWTSCILLLSSIIRAAMLWCQGTMVKICCSVSGGVEVTLIQWSHSGKYFVPWMAQGTTQALRCYKLPYIV